MTAMHASMKHINSDSGLNRVLLGIAAFVMFMMMSLTFIDVLGRYLLRSPIPGAFELIQFMMPFLIFTVLPVISKEDGHITVTVLDSFVPPHVQWAQKLIVQTGSIAAIALVGWCLWHQGQSLNEGRYISGYLEWPIGPVAHGMSILCFATLLVQLVKLYRHLRSHD